MSHQKWNAYRQALKNEKMFNYLTVTVTLEM